VSVQGKKYEATSCSTETKKVSPSTSYTTAPSSLTRRSTLTSFATPRAKNKALETPPTSGMDPPKERVSQLLALDGEALLQDAGRALEFLGRFGARLPAQPIGEHHYLVRMLHNSLH